MLLNGSRILKCRKIKNFLKNSVLHGNFINVFIMMIFVRMWYKVGNIKLGICIKKMLVLICKIFFVQNE